MRTWPALDVSGAADPDGEAGLLIAAVDQFSPTAVQTLGDVVRIFFPTPAARDLAQAALAAGRFPVTPTDVSDEDWARRSQADLHPVTVGRITVHPNPESANPGVPNPESPIPNPISIVILPSMGFGTGHHATTRLCLAALQAADVAGRTVLDVGTGSGVLAIAASLLGASRVHAVDTDADAVQAAADNLRLNRGAHVTLRVGALGPALPAADIVTANLTGALLERSAATLAALVRPGGTLITSGYLDGEREQVRGAFAGLRTSWERDEDGWIGLAMKKS